MMPDNELTVIISVSPPPQVGGRPSVREVQRVVVPVTAPDPGRTVRASVAHRRDVGTEKNQRKIWFILFPQTFSYFSLDFSLIHRIR